MAKIILESVGFCGSTSISKFIENSSDSFVSHGTQNFIIQGGLGRQNLPVEAFLEQMDQNSEFFSNCVAVHCLYQPADIANAVKNRDIRFYGLARRNLKKQIFSCFTWAIFNLLSGRSDLAKIFAETYQNNAAILNRMGIGSNLTSIMMWWAATRVCQYNFALSDFVENFVFLEEFLENGKQKLLDLGINVSPDADAQMPTTNSHKTRLEDSPVLEKADDYLEIILDNLVLKMQQKSYKAGDIQLRLEKLAA